MDQGSINVLVLNDAGQPVPGATLTYTKMAEYTRDPDGRRVVKNVGFTKTATAGSDGRSVLSGLAGGRYDVCANGISPANIGGCEWDGGGVVVLSPGQKAEEMVRHVHDATIITFQVHDPNERVDVPDAKGQLTANRRFFLGVVVPSGAYHRADLVSTTASLKVFRVAVPKKVALRLFIDSEVSISDTAGNRIETSKPSSLTLQANGASELTVDLNLQ
ncbi:MAG: hypothetical protein ABJF23_32205 [Bryobacteraceae bacterium]